jgi:hypothetical protein
MPFPHFTNTAHRHAGDFFRVALELGGLGEGLGEAPTCAPCRTTSAIATRATRCATPASPGAASKACGNRRSRERGVTPNPRPAGTLRLYRRTFYSAAFAPRHPFVFESHWYARIENGRPRVNASLLRPFRRPGHMLTSTGARLSEPSNVASPCASRRGAPTVGFRTIAAMRRGPDDAIDPQLPSPKSPHRDAAMRCY